MFNDEHKSACQTEFIHHLDDTPTSNVSTCQPPEIGPIHKV